MHTYKCVQLRKIILQEHTSVTLVTNIRVSYNRNAINIQIIVLKCMVRHSLLHLNLLVLNIVC
jgi:hypothetical protein